MILTELELKTASYYVSILSMVRYYHGALLKANEALL